MTPGATSRRGGGGVVRPAIPGASPAARIVLPGPFSGKTAAAVRAMEMMAAGEVFFLFFSGALVFRTAVPGSRSAGSQDFRRAGGRLAGLSDSFLQRRRTVWKMPATPPGCLSSPPVAAGHGQPCIRPAFRIGSAGAAGMEVRGALAACRSGTAYTPSSSGVCSSCRERSSLASTASSQSALVKAWASEGKVPARTSSA